MYKIQMLMAGLATLALGSASSATDTLDAAAKFYGRTRYKEAVQALSSLAASGDPAALALLGKTYFMMRDYKKATDLFEAAVKAQPAKAEYHNWLGRTYGRRAETGNPLMAPGLASKARQSFEKAVALDSKNLEAVNDLFAYYVEAPGFLGGGVEKATQLIPKIKSIDPAEAESAFAQLAKKRKDDAAEELYLRKAVEAAPTRVGLLLDLARFLAKRNRYPESDAVFQQAEKLTPLQPRVLYARAEVLVNANRNVSEAKALLERYLKATLTPDDPPRFEAERLLKKATGAG